MESKYTSYYRVTRAFHAAIPTKNTSGGNGIYKPYIDTSNNKKKNSHRYLGSLTVNPLNVFCGPTTPIYIKFIPNLTTLKTRPIALHFRI
jgi:hypothetical protein